MSIRRPEKRDGQAMFGLARACPPLDVNSEYAYFLVADSFADTCVLAEIDGKTAGFVTAFVPPRKKDTLFVWQVGVAGHARGHGIAGRMLSELMRRPSCRDVRYMETTVTSSNEASSRLFQGFARTNGCELRTEIYLKADDFGGGAHEEEVLFRLGPLINK